MMREHAAKVIIVGAGPSGLATSACLTLHSIPHVILEREKCHSSLWKTRAYDRLKLHLAKEFCHLPHMPHKPDVPTFIPLKTFIQYLDSYAEFFNICPIFHRRVESSFYDEKTQMWTVLAKNTAKEDEEELYTGKFLVVATGENSEGNIAKLEGLERFSGEMLHSSEYKSGLKYDGKRVLVVGCGNSGMEIAYDLSNHGALTSIVVRSPFHVVTKEMIRVGMTLLKYFPIWLVDYLIVLWVKFKFGNLSKFKICKPIEGPFKTKLVCGKTPVIDVGTIEMIKTGKIKVLPEISSIEGSKMVFMDGKQEHFDAIVFATGYKSTTRKWFKEDRDFLDEEGMPLQRFPHHWKGKNGVYCVGLSRRALAGVSMDAQAIADDIKKAEGK